MLNWLAKIIAFILLKTFYSFRICGAENIPSKGGFIIACNHVSYIDPIVVAAGSHRQVGFMARDNLFSTPGKNWWLRGLGAFPVKRDYADRVALREALGRISLGKGLVLFPEGTRQQGLDSTAKPYAGIGFLVSKAHTVVVPAFVQGTEIALPRGAKKLKRSKITICFGKPIRIEHDAPYQEIADAIMLHIRALRLAGCDRSGEG